MSQFLFTTMLFFGIISCEMIRGKDSSSLGQINGAGETVTKMSSQSRALLDLCRNSDQIRNKEGRQRLAKANELLDSGADVNAIDDGYCGYTSLHYACYSGDEDLARLLIARGANVNSRAAKGFGSYTTPLHAAAFGQFRKICKILLKAGADVNARCDFELTPLHFAIDLAKSVFDNPIKILLEYGADPEIALSEVASSYEVGSTGKRVPGLEYYINHLIFHGKKLRKRASKKLGA